MPFRQTAVKGRSGQWSAPAPLCLYADGPHMRSDYALRLKTHLGPLAFLLLAQDRCENGHLVCASVPYSQRSFGSEGSPPSKKLGPGMMLHCSNLLFTKIVIQRSFFAYQVGISVPFSLIRLMIVVSGGVKGLERIGNKDVLLEQVSALCEKGQSHDWFSCRWRSRRNDAGVSL